MKTLEQDFEMLKYAKKQVELKEEEIADLKDRLVGLGQAKELEKELLQKQLNDLKNEIHDLRERYDAENSELRKSFLRFSSVPLDDRSSRLGNQVADLEIFRAKQDSYLTRRQQQRDTLQFRQEEHVAKLAAIERKDQTDRDRYVLFLRLLGTFSPRRFAQTEERHDSKDESSGVGVSSRVEQTNGGDHETNDQ